MFTVYLIKVFGVGTLVFALALIKCCGVAINVAGLPNVRETLLQNPSMLFLSLLCYEFELSFFFEQRNVKFELVSQKGVLKCVGEHNNCNW